MAQQTMSSFVRWMACLLGVMSILGSMLLRSDVSGRWVLPWSDGIAAILVLSICRLMFPRGVGNSPRLWMLAGSSFIVAVIPWLSGAVQRGLGFTGEAWEIIAVASIQYAALWLICWLPQSRYQWMGILLSTAMLLFCFVMADRLGLQSLLLAYAIVGSWWLMSADWSRVERGFLETRTTSLVSLRLGWMLGVLLLGGVVGWMFIPAGYVPRLLEGFMPTSGGESYSDPAARSGVGEGDFLVAATGDTNIFGPVESEIFLESSQPTLYDVISELYGEPKQKSKKWERAISLAGMTEKPGAEGRESQEGTREFSTARDPQGVRAKPERTERSAGLMFIHPRLGLHWRMGSCDSFDGVTWRQTDQRKEAPVANQFYVEHHFGKPWIRVAQTFNLADSGIYRTGDLRIVNLRSRRLPTPPGLTHLHIDRIDRADFFGEDDGDGQIIMLDRDHIPQLTTIHLGVRIPNLYAWRSEPDSECASPRRDESAYPSSFASYRAIALAWSQHARNEWQRVESIIDRLRSDFTVDHSASVPADCHDSVTYFLETKRGPDYLFATTAAMLLRSLGIETRMVTGFYARPEKVDPKTRHILIESSDVHCWVEAKIGGSWLALEPTPGYRAPLEYLTWWQWATMSFFRVGRWMYQHPVATFSMVASMLLVGHGWRWIAAMGWIAFCRLLCVLDRGRSLTWTLRMLLGVSRLLRQRKETGETVSEWLYRAWSADGAVAGDRSTLVSIAMAYQHAAYAPKSLAAAWQIRYREALRRAQAHAAQMAVQRVLHDFYRRSSVAVPWNTLSRRLLGYLARSSTSRTLQANT